MPEVFSFQDPAAAVAGDGQLLEGTAADGEAGFKKVGLPQR